MDILFICLLLIFFIMLFSLYQTNDVVLKKYDIQSSKIPKEFNKYKIIFVSDIHYKELEEHKLEAVIKRINEREPDVVILGGDYIIKNILNMFLYKIIGKYIKKEKVVSEETNEHIESVFKKLGTIKAKYGVFEVLGNHDYRGNIEKSLEEMKKYNITPIDNTSYWLREGNSKIKLGGVDTYTERGQDIEATTFDVKDEFTILVTHNINRVNTKDFDSEKIDLLLGAHTHGSFISRVQFLKRKNKFSYNYGYRMNRGFQSIVTSGIGQSAFPIRLTKKPEIVEISLKCDKRG